MHLISEKKNWGRHYVSHKKGDDEKVIRPGSKLSSFNYPAQKEGDYTSRILLGTP